MQAFAATLLLLNPLGPVRLPLRSFRFDTIFANSRRDVTSMGIFDDFVDAVSDAWNDDPKKYKRGYNTPLDRQIEAASDVISGVKGPSVRVGSVADTLNNSGKEFKPKEVTPLDGVLKKVIPGQEVRPEDRVTLLDKWLGIDDSIVDKWKMREESRTRGDKFLTFELAKPMGISLQSRGKGIYVEELLAGSPAKGKVLQFDELVGVDYNIVINKDVDNIVDMIQASPRNSTVLTLYRRQRTLQGRQYRRILDTERVADVSRRELLDHWLERKLDFEARILSMNLEHGLGGEFIRKLQDLEQLQRDILRYQTLLFGRSIASARTKSRLSMTLKASGKWNEAEELARTALKDLELKLKGDYGYIIEKAKVQLALILVDRGKYKEAGELQRGILEANIQEFGVQDSRTEQGVINVVKVLEKIDDLTGAEQLLRAVLAEPPPNEFDDWYFGLKTQLGIILKRKGNLTQAEELLGDVFRMQSANLGINNPRTLNTLDRYAMVLRDIGDTERAVQLHEKVLGSRLELYGHDHFLTMQSKTILAGACRDIKDFTRAQSLLTEVLEIKNSSFGPDHPDTVFTKGGLATVFQLDSKLEQADQLQREVLEARNRSLGSNHPYTLWSMTQLGKTARLCEDFELAEQLHQTALDAKAKLYGPHHPETLSSKKELAAALVGLGNYSGAIALQRELVEDWTRIRGPGNKETLGAVFAMARTKKKVSTQRQRQLG